ncbi:MAG: uroporphyrinogen decarboxylase family protein [Hyphomonadaceae bacterium]|nr:uroporphyrinogen decarboxylase family protein [Clostridia bacterium]
MKRNMKQWKDALITSDKIQALPVLTYPGLKMANKNVMDVITDGQAQFECIKAMSERFPSAAAVTIMDLSLEAEAFGCPIKFSDNEVPTVTKRIVEDEDSVNALKVPKVGDGRTSAYLKAAELSAQSITDKPVFGGHIGPYSLAGRLYDMTEIMMSIMIEPEVIHVLLQKCTDFLIEFSKAFKQAGANGIIIAEPAAGLLSPEMCHDFSSVYVKQIVDAVQDEHFMVILHNCGNTTLQVPTLLSTGAMGLHFGNAIDMADNLPQVSKDVVAFGNIDPASIFKAATPEVMREKVLTLLEKMKPYPNFVLSSGCDVPPGTPLENVEAFYNAMAEFNQVG